MTAEARWSQRKVDWSAAGRDQHDPCGNDCPSRQVVEVRRLGDCSREFGCRSCLAVDGDHKAGAVASCKTVDGYRTATGTSTAAVVREVAAIADQYAAGAVEKLLAAGALVAAAAAWHEVVVAEPMTAAAVEQAAVAHANASASS